MDAARIDGLMLERALPEPRRFAPRTEPGHGVRREGLAALDAPAHANDARARAERVATKFEALFVQQMVSKMREGAEALGEGGVFEGTVGSDTYAQWFDQHMTMHLTEAGANGGSRIGIADQILEVMTAQGQLPVDAESAAPPAAHFDRTPPRFQPFEPDPVRPRVSVDTTL